MILVNLCLFRVVNYRAGKDGYVATGDVGADQEAIRQQQILYVNDPSYRVHSAAWRNVGANNYFDSNNREWTTAGNAHTAVTSGRLVSLPLKSHYHTKTYHTLPYTTYYTTYQPRVYSAPARYVALKNTAVTTTALKSPAAKLTEISNKSSYTSSSSSSASSASSSTSSTSSSATGHLGSTKSVVTEVKAVPVTSGRLVARLGHGHAHSVVNFRQFGPQPFSYSYTH